jgi:hypothetical protein
VLVGREDGRRYPTNDSNERRSGLHSDESLGRDRLRQLSMHRRKRQAMDYNSIKAREY